MEKFKGLLNRVWEGVLKPILMWAKNHIIGIMGFLCWCYVIYTLVTTLWDNDYSYVISIILTIIPFAFYADSWSIDKGKKVKAWFSAILLIISMMFIGASNMNDSIKRDNILVPTEIIDDYAISDSILIIKFKKGKNGDIDVSDNSSRISINNNSKLTSS